LLRVSGYRGTLRDVLRGEMKVPAPTGDWRADLRAIAISTR
jgi:hypothetical protein